MLNYFYFLDSPVNVVESKALKITIKTHVPFRYGSPPKTYKKRRRGQEEREPFILSTGKLQSRYIYLYYAVLRHPPLY